MFITKKRHEDAIELKDLEISGLKIDRDDYAKKYKAAVAEIERLQRNATIDRKAIEDQQKDIKVKRAEIERILPLAQKHLDKLARDRKRVRGGAKSSVKPAAKKGAAK